jgi:hypothetical protein
MLVLMLLLLLVMLPWQPRFWRVQRSSLCVFWPHHQQPVVQALVHLIQAGQGCRRRSRPKAARLQLRRGTCSMPCSQGVQLLPSAAASIDKSCPAQGLCV